jgi:hypothetical protein
VGPTSSAALSLLSEASYGVAFFFFFFLQFILSLSHFYPFPLFF